MQWMNTNKKKTKQSKTKQLEHICRKKCKCKLDSTIKIRTVTWDFYKHTLFNVTICHLKSSYKHMHTSPYIHTTHTWVDILSTIWRTAIMYRLTCKQYSANNNARTQEESLLMSTLILHKMCEHCGERYLNSWLEKGKGFDLQDWPRSNMLSVYDWKEHWTLKWTDNFLCIVELFDLVV